MTDPKKSLTAVETAAMAFGASLGYAALYLAESAFVWALCTYFIGLSLSYLQVLGIVLLFKYVKGQVK